MPGCVEDAYRRPELLSVILPFSRGAQPEGALPASLRSLEVSRLRTRSLLWTTGSIDQTGEIVRQLARPQLRPYPVYAVMPVIRRRSHGRGIRFSKGDILISMDGDFQNDPADIPQLLANWIKLRSRLGLAERPEGRRRLGRNLPSWLANRSSRRFRGFICTIMDAL